MKKILELIQVFSNQAFIEAGAQIKEDKLQIIKELDILIQVSYLPDINLIKSSKDNLIILGTLAPTKI